MSHGIWLLKKLKKHKTVACDYRVITAREIPNGILLQQYCIVSFTNSKKKDWFHSHFNCVGEFLHCGNFVSRSQRGVFQFSFGFENTRFRNIIRPATAKVEIWKGWCTADTDSKETTNVRPTFLNIYSTVYKPQTFALPFPERSSCSNSSQCRLL